MSSVTTLSHAVPLIMGYATTLLIGLLWWLWWQMVRRRQQRNIEKAITAERNRLAMELHDDALQTLYAASLRLENLENTLELVGESAVHVQDEIRQVVAALSKVARSVRGVLGNERSPAVAVLAEELSVLVAEMSSSYGVLVEIVAAQPLPLVIGAEAEQVCHIVREAVSNALRHGKAKNVQIGVTEADQEVTVTIADNGVGFSSDSSMAFAFGSTAAGAATPSQSGGLEHMRRRAAILGGKLHIVGTPGQGVVVTLVFPYEGGPK